MFLHKLGIMRNWLLAALAFACCLLLYFLLPNTIPEAGKRVTVIFLFAIFFWGLEIIPLYATSLVVVLLLTFALTAPVDLIGKGYRFFFIPFSSPVIILFLGGLTLAAAAKRHAVDFFLMEKMLDRLGHRPYPLLLGFLFTTAFFSMWLSNTAATAMMLLLIKPILEKIDTKDPLRKSLVLAVAFGANIGGIGTPIGTPPNAIAMGILRDYGIKLDFVDWMIIAVPLAIVLLLITAGIIMLLFPTKIKQVPYALGRHDKLTKQGKGVCVVALLMIVLWLTEPWLHLPEALVALLGVGLFATFRLITIEEIRSLPWDVLILMWGGLALGEGVQASGIVDTFIHAPLLSQSNLILLILFGLISVGLTSFISNTATANLLLPIAISISPTLALVVAFSCSFAFALPISTPPNALAYSTGYISVKDIFKPGAIISILGLVLLLFSFNYIIPQTSFSL